MKTFYKNIMANKALLSSLITNDFRNRYLGNVLGIAWAFIQPLITITILWFVFQVGFKSKPINDFPFILWLVAGMFPWFYVAETMSSGTNSILANTFLVKKIVFNVGMLPLISLLSALLIHAFFILVMFIMFIFYGYSPSIYWLQLIYYIFASSFMLLGLIWITSSVVVFFKDMGQFVAVVIQMAFWITPIFWSINMIPAKYQWMINLNPINYIIEGYRNSMIYNIWFWENLNSALYFWIFSLSIFILGWMTFNKLRPHFADVL